VLDANLAKIEAEIEKHTKVVGVEEKVIAAVKEKKTLNDKEYTEHIENCQKLKGKAHVAIHSVNDAATTLKNQREY
jgi:hypothetical protein